MTRQQILSEAKALDPREQVQLLDELRQMVGEDELTQDQRVELRRRMEALARGEATLIDGDQAMREVREQLGRR